MALPARAAGELDWPLVPLIHIDSRQHRRQTCGGELLTLQARRAVGDQRKRVGVAQLIQACRRVGEAIMPCPALHAISLSQLLSQQRIVDTLVGEGEVPYLTPVSGRPIARLT
jgi:hypothetical protein